MLRGLALACVATAALLPAALAAQGWSVEASAGRALHDPVSARVSSTSASVGVGYDGRARWLYLSGGAPVQGDGAGWGAGGLGAWLGMGFGPRADVRLGVSAAGHGYAYGAAGPNPAGQGGTVELLPTVEWRRGVLSAAVSSGFSGAADLLGDSTHSRGFHDSAARLSVALPLGLEVGGDARLVRGGGREWPYAGGSAELRREWGGAWAYGGRWLRSGHPSPALSYGAGVRLQVLRRTHLEASLRQEPFDPVFWSAARRTWSVRLTRLLGRPPARIVRPEVLQGPAVFRLPRSAYGEAPALVGDFNGWQPLSMTAEGDHWVARVALDSGAHHYAYRLADGTLVVPDGLATVDDGYGGTSAVLVVP